MDIVNPVYGAENSGNTGDCAAIVSDGIQHPSGGVSSGGSREKQKHMFVLNHGR